MLEQELDMLEEGTSVFKLVGPVLMSIELSEAKENVQKRLEFIEKELEKIESLIGLLYFIYFTVIYLQINTTCLIFIKFRSKKI